MSTSFFPWIRRGMAAGLTATGPGPRAVSLVQFTLNEGQAGAEVAVAIPLAVQGPEDVAALEARAIRRVWPAPESSGSPATCLAYVEFDDPDLPWRYTPAAAAPPRPNRTSDFIPWLALLVLEATEFRDEQAADPGLERLASITVTEPLALPPVDSTWAWTHVQHAGTAAADLAADLAAHPENYAARMLAPRRFRANTRYTAVLVPTFERGRLAGLGRAVPSTVGRAAPAWTTAPVELPVYYGWSFTTGAVDDLEALARRLRAKPVPPSVGARDLDGSGSGELGVPVATAPLRLAGALRPPGAMPDDWPAPQRLAWQQAMAARTALDDRLVPPLYGRWHAARNRLAVANPASWFDDLNADPHHRVAAALGGEVVRRQRETLMASAWEQVAGIIPLNATLRQAQLAREAARRIHARHLANASDQQVLALCAPVMGRVPYGTGTPRISLARHFETSVLPRGVLSGTFRRVTRRYGRISRRQGQEREPRPRTFLARAMTGEWRVRPPRALGRSSLDALADLTRLTPGGGRPPRAVMPFEAPDDRPWWEALADAGVARNPGAARFRQALTAALPSLSAVPAPRAAPPTPDMAGAAATLRAVLDPENAVAASVLPRVTAPAGWAPADPLTPVMTAPSFPQPLLPHLRDLSPDWIAAGLADVPRDSATILAANEGFVNAFLVGANHEMARLLLWRHYPTDQRGTYFRRFWSPDVDDIDAIHTWTASTIAAAGRSAAGRSGAVLVVRGDLLARYPNVLIYATQAVVDPMAPRGRRFPSSNPTVVYPGVVGNLPPDVTYLAFDLTAAALVAGAGWYIVFQELPHEPRFGLASAAGTPAAAIADWSELTWEHLGSASIIDLAANPPAPPAGPTGAPPRPSWSGSSADLALILRRRPIRLAIHASDLVEQP